MYISGVGLKIWSLRIQRCMWRLKSASICFQVVQSKMLKKCKCMGSSSSCTVQTCWRELPHFRTVGNRLKYMFRVAGKVVPFISKMPQGFKPTHLIKEKTKSKKPSTKKIVFLTPPVNYCPRNESLGIPGTVGRKCNKTSIDESGCREMCCGRGYNTHQYVQRWKCKCKFYWCCYVICKRCSARKTEYHCKWQFVLIEAWMCTNWRVYHSLYQGWYMK